LSSFSCRLRSCLLHRKWLIIVIIVMLNLIFGLFPHLVHILFLFFFNVLATIYILETIIQYQQQNLCFYRHPLQIQMLPHRINEKRRSSQMVFQRNLWRHFVGEYSDLWISFMLGCCLFFLSAKQSSLLQLPREITSWL